MMRPRLVGPLLLFLLLSIAGQAGASDLPFARVIIATNPPFRVGQQIEIDVQVLAPNYFLSAPQFPTLDLPGAIVSRSGDRARNFTEEIAGQTYSGIEVRYTIVPQLAQTFRLPPIRFEFRYAAEPGKATPGEASSPPEEFAAAMPSGAAKAGGLLSTVPFEITQSLDRDPGGIETGGALVRTVTVFAKGLPAMMIQPARFDAPEGVRVYPQDPVLADEARDGTGAAGGRRTDRAIYEFRKPGTYTLPAVAWPWYDPTSGQRRIAAAPAVKVRVAANAATLPAIAPEVETQASSGTAWLDWLWRGVGAAFFAGALVFAAARSAPHLLARAKARRAAREQSEPADFARVLQACRSGDGMRAYQALERWSRRAGIVPLAAWANIFGGPALGREIVRLERALFRPSASGEAPRTDAFVSAITAARKAWLRQRRSAQAARAAVPALNPWS